MKHFLKAFLYGLAVWAVPFVVAMIIFPLRESERPCLSPLCRLLLP